jgi:hypothetical protein
VYREIVIPAYIWCAHDDLRSYVIVQVEPKEKDGHYSTQSLGPAISTAKATHKLQNYQEIFMISLLVPLCDLLYFFYKQRYSTQIKKPLIILSNYIDKIHKKLFKSILLIYKLFTLVSNQIMSYHYPSNIIPHIILHNNKILK